MSSRLSFRLLGGFLLGFGWLLVACGQPGAALPTQVAAAALTPGGGDGIVPPTWTAAPPPTMTPDGAAGPASTPTPSRTPLPIPTNTPFTPPPTFTPGPESTPETTVTPDRLPLGAYGPDEAIPLAAFPRPPGDNGWGMHWIPTVKQEPAVVDRFVAEAGRMHIKWVVFLNDGTNVGDNDYLVRQLVANNIMPVMRLYRSNVTPYDGDLGAVVRHYRSLGVYYFQLYNEPNVNVENDQGFANPIHYAAVWADAAREVIANGGLPGFGAFSPGGAFDHYEFLDRTLRALEHNGDLDLLNRAWLSVHNYHGTRPHDDPDGFLLFRKYDAIVRSHLLRSMPMIGTEGGSYSDSEETVKNLLTYQYTYMRDAEPYFMAFSYWLLANQVGGSHDDRWEYQALFRDGYVHPVVADFFYQNSE
ncbi:MAG: hypothetical protein R3248_04215 [Candidatus Promineifilaceae bacterium]|nr:hypothetical protein [Candidatus Promineifilaceae bacterium]